MDMGTSSMDMGGAMATATATGTMAAESTAAAMDMGGGCQISMLWNWYTIDSLSLTTLQVLSPVHGKSPLMECLPALALA
ncbi:hypothetical protein ACHAPG_000949 [Botrytis cinerea]